MVADKKQRVFNYHEATVHALAELVAAAGLDHPNQIRPFHLSHRISTTEVVSFAQLYPVLRPGELIEGTTSDPRFRESWALARAESFAPVA